MATSPARIAWLDNFTLGEKVFLLMRQDLIGHNRK